MKSPAITAGEDIRKRKYDRRVPHTRRSSTQRTRRSLRSPHTLVLQGEVESHSQDRPNLIAAAVAVRIVSIASILRTRFIVTTDTIRTGRAIRAIGIIVTTGLSPQRIAAASFVRKRTVTPQLKMIAFVRLSCLERLARM